MDYLYNSMRLPDISTVWENAMQFGKFSCGLIVRNLDKYYQSSTPIGSLGVYFVTGVTHTGTQVVSKVGGYMLYFNRPDCEYPNNLDEYWNCTASGSFMTTISFNDTDVVWSSHDILNEDGSVYFLASTPVPAVSSTPFSLRSWLTGFALGFIESPAPSMMSMFQSKKMTLCVYPQLMVHDIDSVWTDKEAYPHATIFDFFDDLIICIATSELPASSLDDAGNPILTVPVGTQLLASYLAKTQAVYDMYGQYLDLPGVNMWSSATSLVFSDSDNYLCPIDEYLLWASYDILNTDGTTYLSAYAPVKTGNGMAVYKGVTLPDINAVWTDKETYPYASIIQVDVGLDYPEFAGEIYYLLSLADVVPIWNGSKTVWYGPAKIHTFVLTNSDKLALASGVPSGQWHDAGEDSASISTAIHVPATWTSHDILNTDGSVYLAAYEPILITSMDESVLDNEWPIEWNNLAVKNNTSVELDGTSFLKISDSTPTTDELANCIIVGSSSETGGITFAFDGAETIGSIDVIIYTYNYLSGSIPVVILRVSENTDDYEPGLYFLDYFDEASVDYAMQHITFCLYNGVKMPDIETVWADKQKYPYAFMVISPLDNGATAWLYLTANPVQINTAGLSGLHIPAGGWVQYICSTNPDIADSVIGYNYWKGNMMTGENDMSFDTPEETDIAWANYDVLNVDGSIYLTASTPTPDNEQVNPSCPENSIDPQCMLEGWGVGRLIARSRNKLSIAGSQNWLDWAFDTNDLSLTITDYTPDSTSSPIDTIFSGDTLTIGHKSSQPDSGDSGGATPDIGGSDSSGDSGSGEDEPPITPTDPPDPGETADPGTGDAGDSENTGDTGDSGDTGDAGDSGDSGSREDELPLVPFDPPDSGDSGETTDPNPDSGDSGETTDPNIGDDDWGLGEY